MKTPLLIAILSLWASISYAQGGYVDDLYRGSTKKSKKAEAEAKAKPMQQPSRTSLQQQQAMPVQWTPAQTSSSSSYGTTVSNTNLSGDAELVTGYDEALQRRLDAYKNYKEMDDSYWQLMENYHKMLTNRYDPDLYNVITFGNEMWVEPKYISALFDGSDPSAGVRGKEFYVAQPQQKTNITINVGMNLSPWGWDDPWDYYPSWRWGSRWSYWNRPYWGPSWSWGGGYYPGGWGPSWGYPGYYPGWGPSWGGGGYYPPYHPPYYPGGGHHHYYPSRPVIWGNNRPGYGPAPSLRPGSGSGSTGRPGYTGGYRRNENGTGVAIGGAGVGAGDRRPTGNIRPGGTQNQYNPGQNARPSTGGQTTRPADRPSTERSYRRETTTTTAPRRESTTTTTTPRRESTYTAPSRSNSNSSGSTGSYGGGSRNSGSSGSSGGGGGARRR